MWNNMSDEQKEPFNKLAQADKERYDRQKQELDTQGYFTLDDGTKSTDPVNLNKSKKQKSPPQ